MDCLSSNSKIFENKVKKSLFLPNLKKCSGRSRDMGQFFGMSIAVINGETGVETKVGSRQGLLDDFQEKKGFNIIILSTTAMGFGVNIQQANHVIHFTRAWNPAKEDQATDRAYRIGQEKEVTVYAPHWFVQISEHLRKNWISICPSGMGQGHAERVPGYNSADFKGCNTDGEEIP